MLATWDRKNELRPLGEWEAVLSASHRELAGTGQVVTVLELDRPLEQATVVARAQAMVGRHPLLRATIRVEGARAWFSTAGVLALACQAHDGTSSAGLLRRHQSRILDPTRSLFALDAYLGDTRSSLVCTFHHAIVDGVALTTVQRELLGLVSGPNSGSGLRGALEAMVPPSSVSDEELTERADQLAHDVCAPLTARRTQVVCIQLPLAFIREAIVSSGTAGAGLTAFLHACLMRAAARAFSRTLTLKVSTPVDMRARCSPSVASMVVGSYVCMAEGVVQVAPQASLSALASQYVTNVLAHRSRVFVGAACGDHASLTQMCKDYMVETPYRFTNGVGVSNRGSLDLPGARAFYSCVGRALADFIAFASVGTIADEMCLTVATPHPCLSTARAATLVEEFCSGLDGGRQAAKIDNLTERAP